MNWLKHGCELVKTWLLKVNPFTVLERGEKNCYRSFELGEYFEISILQAYLA